MNRWEKEVQRSLLKDEQRILRVLRLMYEDVSRETQERIAGFYARLTENPADAAAVYQLRYQQVLAAQLADILAGFENRNYTTIESYLEDCYTGGFVGAMYDIHRQGISVIAPIRQENVVRAVTLDSRISVPMYTRLGNNIAQLKTAIAAEVTRGIASGHSWHDTAAGIARQGNVSAYNAMRIARTEGHRIACEAQYDACLQAQEAGANIVRQWDAILDGVTRPHHRELHGQVREMGQPFEVGGLKAMYPGGFGRPEEDIHCRCCLLQRARWALDEEELERLRSTADARELEDAGDFEEFRERYLEYTGNSVENPAETVDNSAGSGIIKSIEIDDFELRAYGKGISQEVQEELFREIKLCEKNAGFVFSDVKIDRLFTESGGIAALQTEMLPNSLIRLNISTDVFSGATVEEINQRFAGTTSILAQDLHEAMVHEQGHAKAMRGRTVSDVEEMLDELKNIHVPGISQYAFSDGSECIAETEILLERGEDVPDEAMDIYRKYVLRE